MRKFNDLLFLAIFLTFHVGCRDGAQTVQKDKERFGLISPSRPVGAPCAPGDTASITRRPQHPLGPTGGWRGAPLLDPARSYSGSENQFLYFNGAVSGYVRYPIAGELKARSYDDVYGAVYCGFSPERLQVAPTDAPVFVRFPTCVVGDGGLNEVTEICWFPAGSATGSVVYSSAHPGATTLTAADVYRAEDLVTEFGAPSDRRTVIRIGEARTVLHHLLLRGDSDGARRVVEYLSARLPHHAGHVDGVTAAPIPSEVGYCDTWFALTVTEAALGVRTERAIERLTAAVALIDRPGSTCRGPARALLPLYRWLAERLAGRDPPLPTPLSPPAARPVHGYDPAFIGELLRNPKKTDRTLPAAAFALGGRSSFFWLGVREYLAGNGTEAARYWSLFRREPPADNLFELGVIAALGADG